MTETRLEPPKADTPIQPRPTESISGPRALALLVAAVTLSVAASMLVAGVSGQDAWDATRPAAATDTVADADTAAAAELVAAGVEAARIARDPADVPPPVGARGPAVVQVDLDTQEVRGQLADGTAYDYWTFGGTVPGPMIRARVGDTIELTLSNSAESGNPHSIDLHAVNGPGGGAVVTQVPPGESRTLTFEALNPGVYVYHCATPHIPTHIANGMYGLIAIEPDGGLPPVDREFYVMQGEVYTDADRGTQGPVAYDGDTMQSEDPTYVVFNGQVQALTGDHAMQAEVGERVRLFVGNGGPNLISSFHVIGEIFDVVHDEGASAPKNDVQTTLVPAGGATWVEFNVDVPGDYLLVDHSITRAIDKGAVGILHVSGDANPSIYDGVFPEPGTDTGHGDPGAEEAAADAGELGVIEFGMTEFTYTPAQTEIPAGEHTFRITNDGAVPHEWALSPAGSHDEHIAMTAQLAPGESEEVTVTLEPGTYEFACHIPGHYEAGMRGTLTVAR